MPDVRARGAYDRSSRRKARFTGTQYKLQTLPNSGSGPSLSPKSGVSFAWEHTAFRPSNREKRSTSKSSKVVEAADRRPDSGLLVYGKRERSQRLGPHIGRRGPVTFHGEKRIARLNVWRVR